MPLAFQSLSHGTVAFGFFNIDTDLLLLEHYFLFAPEFCRHVGLLAQKRPLDYHTSWEAYDIPSRSDIGDLMGAIHGIRFTGFIGEVYRRFPFPERPEDFKQKFDGMKNKDILESLLDNYALRIDLPLHADPQGKTVAIGEYRFSSHAFQELVRYVWLGGYPQWKEGIRPAYVIEMKSMIEQNPNWLFSGLRFLDE